MLERQKPLNEQRVINEKDSISCIFLKYNLNFNTERSSDITI
jgi:hypothetical protein